MTTTLTILICALIVLFVLTIYILVKQFLTVRKEEQSLNLLENKEEDCEHYYYTAKVKMWDFSKLDVYTAKKSGMTPLIPLHKVAANSFADSKDYNSISTY